ncbi:MAG TPA: mismatch-specific DNA-glycosylase [Pantanalinema sp.]
MLTDLLHPGLDLVFCGTAAGTESARRQAYYAGPGNKFWRTLHRAGLTPRQLKPEEYVQLPEFGIGLTDLVKGKAGMDHTLQKADYDREGFEQRILEAQPKVICFNGKQATMAYLQVKKVEFGLQAGCHIGATQIFVAPSTSGAASGFWDEAVWFELAKLAGRS